MLKEAFNKAFLLFVRFASDPGDNEEWRIKKIIAALSAIAGTPTLLGYGLLFRAYNEWPAASVLICAAVLWFIGLLIYGVMRNFGVIVASLEVIFILTLVLAHVLLGGFALSGATLVWLLVSPIMVLVMYKTRHGLAVFLVVVAIVLCAAFLEPYYQRTSNNIPSMVITAMYVFNILGAGIFLLFTVFYYVWRNQLLSRQVQSEQEKADALLLNILPKDIAATLKNESRLIADHYDGASVLFADVVNFTPLATTMKPTELVDLLNEVFSSFDILVEKYALEKIKTIGDCYMAAAGVPHNRSDHAHVLTRMALDIRDHTRKNTYQGKQLSFRIGISSGPVVAGVIGRKKFIYDLWGDAVNTASRMESHGAEGIVQITQDTYALIKDDFVCEPRGVINVKGKGQMNVWSVLSVKPLPDMPVIK